MISIYLYNVMNIAINWLKSSFKFLFLSIMYSENLQLINTSRYEQ